MRRLTTLFILVILSGLLSSCGSGAQRTTDNVNILATYFDNGYYIDAAAMAKILAVDDPDTRRNMFFDNAQLIQQHWACDKDTFLWLLKQVAKGRQIP